MNAARRLNQAHHLMNEGQYLRAANLFEELAQGAVRFKVPRAPFLFLQAGRGFLFGGQDSKGFVMIRRGLKMLADAGRWADLYRVGHRTAEELAEKGHQAESERLETWLEETLPEKSEQVREIRSKVEPKRPKLPTHCPKCGGTVDSKAIIWMDEITAECLYCGSAIRAET
jgi:hypothetical protein